MTWVSLRSLLMPVTVNGPEDHERFIYRSSSDLLKFDRVQVTEAQHWTCVESSSKWGAAAQTSSTATSRGTLCEPRRVIVHTFGRAQPLNRMGGSPGPRACGRAGWPCTGCRCWRCRWRCSGAGGQGPRGGTAARGAAGDAPAVSSDCCACAGGAAPRRERPPRGRKWQSCQWWRKWCSGSKAADCRRSRNLGRSLPLQDRRKRKPEIGFNVKLLLAYAVFSANMLCNKIKFPFFSRFWKMSLLKAYACKLEIGRASLSPSSPQ